jgi:hypothetical protein
MSNVNPFKVGKTKNITIGRRQAERATEVCNKVGKTPEQLIKDKIEKLSSSLT